MPDNVLTDFIASFNIKQEHRALFKTVHMAKHRGLLLMLQIGTVKQMTGHCSFTFFFRLHRTDTDCRTCKSPGGKKIKSYVEVTKLQFLKWPLEADFKRESVPTEALIKISNLTVEMNMYDIISYPLQLHPLVQIWSFLAPQTKICRARMPDSSF